MTKAFLCLALVSSLLLNQVSKHYGFIPVSVPYKSVTSLRQERNNNKTNGLFVLNDNDEIKPVTTTYAKSPPSTRRVSNVEKFSRLPVWPAWNGAFLFLLSKVFGQEFAAKLEDTIGGRVCPNFFDYSTTTPFIMLVHHRHSFSRLDPLRYFQKSFFPEGFPAHAHRGFVTVTYCLRGGMIHRDSLGVKQLYGAEKRHGGKHTQWLNTGAGILHEEMWDTDTDKDGSMMDIFKSSDQELYQLWLNLPSGYKMDDPDVILMGQKDEDSISFDNIGHTPVVKDEYSETVVLVGEHNGYKAGLDPPTPIHILHVKIHGEKKGALWTHSLPETFETCVVYVRSGSINIEGQRIPAHHTAYLTPFGSDLVVEIDDNSTNKSADILILAGQPIREPIAASGSMVMNSNDEINVAYADYQMGKMGLPWDHKINDDEWKNHVGKFPSIYGKEFYNKR